MMYRKIMAGMGVALLAATVGGAAAANATESTESELLRLNPGLTISELQRSADETARQTQTTREAVYAQALQEAAESAQLAQTPQSPMTRSSGGGTVNLGGARQAGDVFISPASTLFIQHGHTGIYSIADTDC